MSIAEAKELTGLFHEQQIGALCGQHVLNNLFQGTYVTLDSLDEVARQLDKHEHEMLYNRPNEPYNLEEAGFCNIQVLQTMLNNMELELIPFNSKNKIAEEARAQPTQVRAYICNLAEHWFAIRKFGQYYFDLNSMYTIPNLMYDEMLMEELEFVQSNGGSIFIVHGRLPDCDAEKRLNSPTFDPFKYLSIARRLPRYCVDKSMCVSLEGPGPDGKYILRVPPMVMDEYEKNPNSPKIQKVLDKILPPQARGRVVLARRNESEEMTSATAVQMTTRILIIRQHVSASMDSSGKCQCQSCLVSKNASRVDEAMNDYHLAVEQITRYRREVLERQRELDLQQEKYEQQIEKYSSYIKLSNDILKAESKLFEDMQKFEKANDKLDNYQMEKSNSRASVVNSMLQLNDCFTEVIGVGDLIKNDLRAYEQAREALYQYQYDQAIQESLSSMNSTAAIETTETKTPLAIAAPTPPDDNDDDDSTPSVNTKFFESIVPDSSLPTDDDSQRSSTISDSPPPTVPEMTVEELRALRQKKFGNRNVSLISRIYSPTDP